MEYANIMLELGGDSGTTVPKPNVSAAEVAVLMAIHGNSAVKEIDICEPVGDKPASNRQERSRLLELYGRAKDGNDNSIVETMFPGVAARVFETFEELEIPDEFYKADRATPKSEKAKAVKPAKGRGKKATEAEVVDEPDEPTETADEDDDGEVGDMPDGGEKLFT